jgi:hypothetical protein
MGYWIVPDLKPEQHNVWYLDMIDKVSIAYFQSVEALLLVYPDTPEYVADEATATFHLKG